MNPNINGGITPDIENTLDQLNATHSLAATTAVTVIVPDTYTYLSSPLPAYNHPGRTNTSRTGSS